MRHFLSDRYAATSLLGKVNPLIKVGITTYIVFILAFTPRGGGYVYWRFFALLTVIVLINRIPLLFFLKRVAVMLPFLLLFAAGAVFNEKIGVAALYRASLSIGFLALLIVSTPFNDILKSFQKVGVPEIFLKIISFLYRYFFVFEDQFMRMNRAAQARMIKPTLSKNFNILPKIIGKGFIISYERGERIYNAMLSRHYTGKVFGYTRALSFYDIVLIFVLFAGITVLRFYK